MIAARSGTMRARDGVVDEDGDHDSAATVDLATDVSKITHGTFRRFFSSDRQTFLLLHVLLQCRSCAGTR